MADEVRLGSVEASQKLMQGAEHLSGERCGDRGLGVAALPSRAGSRRSSLSMKRRTAPSSSLRPPSIGRPATVASGRIGKVR